MRTLLGGPVQVKVPEEVAIQQYCNDIGSAAHVELMRYAKVSSALLRSSLSLPHCLLQGAL